MGIRRMPVVEAVGLDTSRTSGGVGHDLSVTTIRLVPEPDCADGAP